MTFKNGDLKQVIPYKYFSYFPWKCPSQEQVELKNGPCLPQPRLQSRSPQYHPVFFSFLELINIKNETTNLKEPTHYYAIKKHNIF